MAQNITQKAAEKYQYTIINTENKTVPKLKFSSFWDALAFVKEADFLCWVREELIPDPATFQAAGI